MKLEPHASQEKDLKENSLTCKASPSTWATYNILSWNNVGLHSSCMCILIDMTQRFLAKQHKSLCPDQCWKSCFHSLKSRSTGSLQGSRFHEGLVLITLRYPHNLQNRTPFIRKPNTWRPEGWGGVWASTFCPVSHARSVLREQVAFEERQAHICQEESSLQKYGLWGALEGWVW